MKITESKFEIKDTENYYNLVNMYADAQSVVANVPKFMPQIPIAKPKNTIGRINRSMFCNDTDMSIILYSTGGKSLNTKC